MCEYNEATENTQACLVESGKTEMPICACCQQRSGVAGSGELVAGLGTQVKADLGKSCWAKPTAGAFTSPDRNSRWQVLPTGQ